MGDVLVSFISKFEYKSYKMTLWIIRSLYDVGLENRFKDSCLRGRIVWIYRMSSLGFGIYDSVSPVSHNI